MIPYALVTEIPCDEGISLGWCLAALFPSGGCQTECGWLAVLVRLVRLVLTHEMVAWETEEASRERVLAIHQERVGAFLAIVARTKYARAPAPKAAAIPIYMLGKTGTFCT